MNLSLNYVHFRIVNRLVSYFISSFFKESFSLQMFYDGEERIFSMRLNAEADRDAPFVGNATIPKGITNIHIVHDFQYG